MNIILIVLLVSILIIPLWALFSAGGEAESIQNLNKEDEANRPFRRRSEDKELEEEFPDESKDRRRKEHRRGGDAASDELTPVEHDFSLPYSPHDVIPDNSPFDIYSRTLKNADVYMQKGDFNTARSIYEGVLDRVGDSEIREKLEENLDYINNYHQIISKRNEIKKQQAPLKQQEIRLTLEGAETLADRLQIGISPEKPPLDVNEIVDRISEKLTAVAPDASRIAENSVQKYREELQQVKSQLKDMTSIREQLKRMNEAKLTDDLDAVQKLKDELSRVMKESAEKEAYTRVEKAETVSAVAEEQLADKERRIREEIKHREDENRILRDRLELMQGEISKLKDDNKKTGELEQKIESTLQKDSNAAEKKDDEIVQLKQELSSLKDELKYRNEAEAVSMRELAESMKQTLNAAAFENRRENESALKDIAESMKQTVSSLMPQSENNYRRENDTALKDIAQAMKENLDAMSPMMKDSADKSLSDNESIKNLSEAMKEGMETLAPLIKDQTLKAEQILEEKRKEDAQKDDFQLLDELINGPKFDEPTDDDVMEKILNDAMREQKKKDDAEKKKKDQSLEPELKPDSEKKAKENKPKDDLKEDFELVSDYMRGPDDGMPTDDEVMEKILKDAMKSREFDGHQSGDSRSQRSSQGRDFPQPQKRKKELPILRVSYNFSRLPDEFTLSTDKNYLEYSFYKYKPLLEKAGDLVKRRKVKDAVNYYKVVMDQDIPDEFKEMLGQNIHDLNEYLTKYYTSE